LVKVYRDDLLKIIILDFSKISYKLKDEDFQNPAKKIADEIKKIIN